MEHNSIIGRPPDGYSAVSPYFRVENVEPLLEFLKELFGATVHSQLRSPSGVTWHAEARIGDTVIMIGKANRAYPATSNAVYVWSLDVDKSYKQALKHGATPLEEPTDQFYGLREAGIRDPEGNAWWIGQQIERLTHEDVERQLGDIPPDP